VKLLDLALLTIHIQVLANCYINVQYSITLYMRIFGHTISLNNLKYVDMTVDSI